MQIRGGHRNFGVVEQHTSTYIHIKKKCRWKKCRWVLPPGDAQRETKCSERHFSHWFRQIKHSIYESSARQTAASGESKMEDMSQLRCFTRVLSVVTRTRCHSRLQRKCHETRVMTRAEICLLLDEGQGSTCTHAGEVASARGAKLTTIFLARPETFYRRRLRLFANRYRPHPSPVQRHAQNVRPKIRVWCPLS